MREILFRGKTIQGNLWVYGFYAFVRDRHFIILSDGQCIEVITETVGQYTGLTDKNGTKIFEGDVFKFGDEVWESCYTSCGMEYNSWEVKNYGVVGYDKYNARYDFTAYKYNENSIEADLNENHNIVFSDFVSELDVIGNIHDNPELLKGEQK